MAKQKEDEDRKRAEEERLRRQAKEKQEQEEAQRMIQESARAPSPVPAASPSPTPPVQPAAAATYQVSPAALAGTLLKEEEEVAEKAGSHLPSTRGGQTCPFCLCAEIRTAGCCRGERRTSVRGGVGETFHRAGGSVSDS